ncbi:hypothetical protein SNE40_021663 [Patella caerulea]|uniref:HAT C-terminal dimerisation domain-containing protein n=1 Tax=Patella caerulea TaxID=87958 RepID=A0AAN8G8F3_PATCE
MVTNRSGERSFSALARIKNHLRSTMGQDCMESLALLCVEANLLDSINLDEIIKTFARRKARKEHIV